MLRNMEVAVVGGSCMWMKIAVTWLVRQLSFSNIHLDAMLLASFNNVWSLCKPGPENLFPGSTMHVAHLLHPLL